MSRIQDNHGEGGGTFGKEVRTSARGQVRGAREMGGSSFPPSWGDAAALSPLPPPPHPTTQACAWEYSWKEVGTPHGSAGPILPGAEALRLHDNLVNSVAGTNTPIGAPPGMGESSTSHFDPRTAQAKGKLARGGGGGTGASQ